MAFSALTTLAMVAVVTVASTVGVAAVAGTTTGTETATDTALQLSDDSDEYVVIQGDRCIDVEPLGDGHRTVEEYYDYRTPNTTPSGYSYSSHGTTHLQEDDTSLLFLHEGSDGLSLVFVHDQYDGNTDGGAATMLFTGLPEEGEWVVEDDNYEGGDEEWDHRETSSRITSVWSEARTDGGAFNGGLDDEFAIEVTPAFNDLADFQVYDGNVTDWQVVSGSDHDPERTSLAMHEPIQIRTGSCIHVTDLEVSESAIAGEHVDVEATVENLGEQSQTGTVSFTVDDESVDEQEVTLEPNETATLTSTFEFDEAGTYSAGAGGVTADVTVSAPDRALSVDEMTGIAIGAVALVALLVALIVRRRR